MLKIPCVDWVSVSVLSSLGFGLSHLNEQKLVKLGLDFNVTYEFSGLINLICKYESDIDLQNIFLPLSQL